MGLHLFYQSIWPQGYKNIFMLNSTEHEISTAHKTKMPTNEDVSCFKSLRCIYHANLTSMQSRDKRF